MSVYVYVYIAACIICTIRIPYTIYIEYVVYVASVEKNLSGGFMTGWLAYPIKIVMTWGWIMIELITSTLVYFYPS